MTEARDAQYRALRTACGLVDLPGRGAIAVTGADRSDFLQGLLTNDITALAEGEGCYAVYLTPQGRLIADMRVFHLGDALLLDVHADVKDLLVERLGSLVFAEDVRIGDWTPSWSGVALHGPTALDVTQAVLGAEVADLGRPPDGRYVVRRWSARAGAGSEVVKVMVARSDEWRVPGLSVWIPPDGLEGLREALMAAGAVSVDHAAADTMRIEAGLPSFPEDMDNETIPLEAGIEDRAISPTKGCYVGQEVIIRILHRGQGRVARKLVGLTLDLDAATADEEETAGSGAALLVAGAAVWRDTATGDGDNPIGRITSATRSVRLGREIALGYVPRKLAEPGTEVLVVVGAERRRAVVTQTPFIAPQ